MNSRDLAILIERGLSENKKIADILSEAGLKLDFRTEDGSGILDIILSEEVISLNEIDLSIVIKEIIYSHTPLMIEPKNNWSNFLDQIFSLFSDKNFFADTILLFLKTKTISPNIIVNDIYLLEFCIEKKEELGERYNELISCVIESPEFDCNALIPSIGGILSRVLDLDIRLFIRILTTCPKATDFWLYESTSRLSGVINRIILSDLTSDEALVILDYIPGILLDGSCARATMRMLNLMCPREEERFDKIPLIVNKTYEFQINKGEYILSLASYFVACAYTEHNNELLKKAFADILHTIPLSEFINTLREIDENEAVIFTDILYLLIDDYSLLPIDAKSTIIDIIDELVINHIHEWSSSAGNETKQLALLLKLQGSSHVAGELEGGNIFYSALYLSKLIGKVSPSEFISQSSLDFIETSISRAVFYMLFLSQESNEKLNKYVFNAFLETMNSKGVLVLTGWKNHCVVIWLCGDFLFKCNGGSCSTDSSIEVYRINKKDNIIGVVYRALNGRDDESNREFLQKDIHSALELEILIRYKGVFQRTNNCSMHSVILGLLSIISTFVGNSVSTKALNKAGVILSNLIFEAKVIGLEKELKVRPLSAQALISRGISMSHGPGGNRDGELYLSIFKEGKFEVDEELIALQMYEHTILSTSEDERVNCFEKVLTKFELFPFDRLSTGGQYTPIIQKIFNRDKELEDSEVIAFHNYIKDFTLLHLAVILDSTDIFKKVFAVEPELLNHKDINMLPPIAYVKSNTMLSLLFECGAQIDWGSSHSQTLTSRVVSKASYSLVLEVVDAGSRITSRSLMASATNPDLRVQELILSRASDLIDCRASNGQGPLHLATRVESSVPMNRLLSRHKSRERQVDINGMTPLWFAVLNRRIELAITLSRHPQLVVSDPHRGDRLEDFLAAIDIGEEAASIITSSRVEKTNALSYFKEDFSRRKRNSYIRDRSDPVAWLILAVSEKDIKACRGVLQNYPDLRIDSYSETFASTALHRAIEVHLPIDFIELLLKLPGVRLDCVNGGGETLAQIAAMNDNVEVLNILSSLGARMNTPDNVGYTPLMDAADRGCVNAVKYLLTLREVDSSYRCQHGMSALDIAKKSRTYNPEICSLLEVRVMKNKLY